MKAEKIKIQLSEREEREYNLAAAILIAAEGRDRKGLVFDVSDEIASRSPRDNGGIFVPHTLSMRAGLDTATATKGGELKFTKGYTFIEALRNRSRVFKAGATVLDNLVADANIPKQVAADTATWPGQNPGSDVADSNVTFASVALSPKPLIVTTSYSRQLLAQSADSADVDTLVRGDLAKLHGTEIDRVSLNGTGTTQPLGLVKRVDLGAQLIVFGVNGTQPSWAQMTSFELAAAVANGDADELTGAFIITPEIRNTSRTKDRTAGTSGQFIMSDENTIAGYPVYATNQLPKTLTKGTSSGVCHAVTFGFWSDLLIGLWGGFEIVPDQFRLKKQGMIELTTHQLIDTSVRHIGAFAVSLDALV